MQKTEVPQPVSPGRADSSAFSRLCLTENRISRRDFLKVVAGAAVLSSLPVLGACSAFSEPVETVYHGEVFDSGGAVLNIADGGGWWEEFNWKSLLTAFEKDFNCRVNYDAASPFYPKLAAAGMDYPAYDIVDQNMGEAIKSQDFYVSAAEYLANVPNAANLWEPAKTGPGLIWLFARCGYGYRKGARIPQPTGFKDLWNSNFQKRRGAYDATQSIQQIFFMAASKAFGRGFDDTGAGMEAMRAGQPWVVGQFTFNGQTELSNGSIDITPLTDAETYTLAGQGKKVDWLDWGTMTAPLVQVKNVTKGSKKKRLAYALLNRFCSPEVQEQWAAEYYWHPTNKSARIPENLASRGITNASDPFAGLWLPDWSWWNDHEKALLEQMVIAIGQ
ncbi:MAG: extracellular solute-binding protein [Chloroflexi bacterium]|nr:extracellular solute-binding protein [Chloroflexota bacterium]